MTLKDELEYISGKFLIYGAHLIALECCRFLRYNGKGDRMSGFAVSNKKDNPEELEGFPVREISEYRENCRDHTIIIAMPKKYHAVAECRARDEGFKNFIRVGLEEMSLLKGRQIIEEQWNHPEVPFHLEESNNDGSWLDIKSTKGKSEEFCKFPTLFYKSMDEVFRVAENLDFQKDYRETLGNYRNIHNLPKWSGKERKSPVTQLMQIYMIFSNKDSKIGSSGIKYAPWICPLHAGERDAGLEIPCWYDNAGESIADKNHIFAEMTGAFWIWKNANDAVYKGLCHYRRHFIISEDEIRELEQNKIDVILTVPRYVPYGVGNMFLAETPVKKRVFETMFQAIQEYASEDEISFRDYMKSCFYYPNNMVIARNDIYNAYCKWVFRILFRMMEIETEQGYGHDDDRHLAYAAELLTSFYFVKNKDNYQIAVTDYQFYR